MKLRKTKLAAVVALSAFILGATGIRQAAAQSSGGLTLYEDTRTGALYRTPGRHRVVLGTFFPATAPPVAPAAVVKQEVEQQVKQSNDQFRAEFLQRPQELIHQNQTLQAKYAEIAPAAHNYLDNLKDKLQFGTQIFADYRFYTHSSFGPVEGENLNTPGIGNNDFNSFDITRGYLDLHFFPTNDWTVRLTPDVYRELAGGITSDTGGSSTSTYPATADGNIGFRLKYAFLQYNKLFDRLGIKALSGDTITFGQQGNPLVDWQNNLYGFRYVNYTPWNYLGLASSQQGLSIQGPVNFNERQYADYDFGVYNNGSYHAIENSDTKEFMGRLSVYPFGAKWRYEGLGFTGFYNYGYGNVTPDTLETSPLFSGPKAYFSRVAAIVHYTSELWGLAFEYDQGHNAFTAGNLFSSSAPSTTGVWGVNSTLATALLNNGRAVEQGFDAFGHLHIPQTPFTLFGTFQWFEPNTHVDINPFDFQRWVMGVSYQYNEFLRFALSSQNLDYYRSQFAFPEAVANTYAPEFKTPKVIANSVLRDEHAFFLSAEFAF